MLIVPSAVEDLFGSDREMTTTHFPLLVIELSMNS